MILRTRLLAVALLTLAGASGTAAQSEVSVAITTPDYGAVVFGPTQVAAEVYSAETEVTGVDFYLDGFLAASAKQRPYEVVIDTGQQNREHLIEVVAVAGNEPVASSSIRTAEIVTDLVVDVELRQLFVTVLRDQQRVTGLPRDAFTIKDDGVTQPTVTFASSDVPFSAVLMVDASDSMVGGKFEAALAGAAEFLAQMKPSDEAKVILFSDEILKETPFSSMSGVLQLGVTGVEPEGGTAVNDALYFGLKSVAPRLSRKVLILLSDGGDVESALPMSGVQTVLRQEQAVLYWIRLTGSRFDPAEAFRLTNWRDAEANQQQLDLLVEAVEESGGRIIPISSPIEISPAFSAIFQELRDQFVLGYYPLIQRGPGSWHRIDVDVRGDYDVRVRAGYLER